MTPEAFAEVANTLDVALMLVAQDGTVAGINRAAVRLIGGSSPDHVLHRPMADLVDDPDDRLADLLRACSRSLDETIGTLHFIGQPHSQRISGRRVQGQSTDGHQVLLRLEAQKIALNQFLVLNEKVDQLSREARRREAAEAQLTSERDVAEFGRDIGMILIHSHPLSELLHQCTELMVKRLDAAAAQIWLTDSSGQQLELVSSQGPTPAPAAQACQIRFGQGKIGRIAQTQSPLLTDDACAEDEFNDDDDPHLHWMRQHCVTSLAGYPLFVDGATVGVIGIYWNRPLRDSMVAAMTSVANAIALRVRKQCIEDGLAKQTMALQEADRRKDEFLAMLSHELRNPLAPVRNGLDLMALEPNAHQETIQMMQQQVEHLVRLVDDLLDVSRIMRGRVELRRAPVMVSDLVDHAVATLRDAIAQAQQDLNVQVPREPIWIDADAVRIKQVLENLLKNACKYTDPGGQISLDVLPHGSDVVFRVRDNGIGIDAELLPEIFDLFRQSTQTLDRAQGGLGIGLTLVKNLIEMHDGQVTVASDGPGTGCTFEIRLATCDPPPQPSLEPGAALPAVTNGSATGLRILAVDDNRSARLMLSRLFEKLGPHQVVTAEDGPTALQQMSEFRPHLVVLDIGLPGMDGFEVAKAIRQHEHYDAALLVALTGYGQSEDRLLSKQAGFDLHLVKPPGIVELRDLFQHPKILATVAQDISNRVTAN